jgi:hypothetical protein
VDQVYFRAIAANWDSFLDPKRPRPQNISQAEQCDFLDNLPLSNGRRHLPATTDIKERTFNTPAPTTIKPGFYFVFASHDPRFGEKENQVSMTTVWVSELALVLRTRAGLGVRCFQLSLA